SVVSCSSCLSLLLFPCFSLCFFLSLPRPPRSTLFPYTTLFRSLQLSSALLLPFSVPAAVDCKPFLLHRKNFGYFLLSLHLTLFQNYPEQVVIQELNLVIYTFFLLLFLFLFFFYNCQTLLELATFYLLIDCFATGFHSI